jgi:hypothetical protein
MILLPLRLLGVGRWASGLMVYVFYKIDHGWIWTWANILTTSW